ncbi:aquaporin [Cellulomonas sp. NPDC055163]
MSGPTTLPPVDRALARAITAELVGTALLVAVVVGSGIAAQRLSPSDVGLQLLQNSLATTLGLTVLILLFGPASGAHLNPVVSLADWVVGRRTGTGLTGRHVVAYAAAQTVGAVAGCALAAAMFAAPVAISTTDRTGSGLLVSEVVATAGLVALILTLVRTGRGVLAAPAVGAYIGAAYWFTASTSFANPAVTVGRVFTDTFAGIAPDSVPGFIAAQLVGAALAVGLVTVLYPTAHADAVVVPHDDPVPRPRVTHHPATTRRSTP